MPAGPLPVLWPVAAFNFLWCHIRDEPLTARKNVKHDVGTPYFYQSDFKSFGLAILQGALYACFGWIAWITAPCVSEAKEFAPGWMLQIMSRDLLICLGCYTFWHWLLTASPLEKRFHQYKFSAKRAPTSQVQFEKFYTTLGVLHGSALEIVAWSIWARGKLCVPAAITALFGLDRGICIGAPQMNYDIKASIVPFVVLSILVPFWREFHFYFAHRSMHPLYPLENGQPRWYDVGRHLWRFHKLHHLSKDPTTWSGMSMHPVEHLLYFSCAWPHILNPLSLVPGFGSLVPFHPFQFLFNKWHLYLSPIPGGHDGMTGYFHWIHHAKPECNYGAGGLCLDALFGTYRDGSRYFTQAVPHPSLDPTSKIHEPISSSSSEDSESSAVSESSDSDSSDGEEVVAAPTTRRVSLHAAGAASASRRTSTIARTAAPRTASAPRRTSNVASARRGSMVPTTPGQKTCICGAVISIRGRYVVVRPKRKADFLTFQL